MGYLCDRELERLLDEGHIRLDLHHPDTDFHPMEIDNVKTVSIDFRVGDFYYRPQGGPDEVLNPFDQQSIDAFFGDVQYAIPAGKWAQEHGKVLRNIPEDHPLIVLEPGEWILLGLRETIGLSANPAITCKMISRSTVGRLGIDAWKDTGWIEPGYFGPIGVPVSNDGPSTFPLVVGMPIAQGLFQASETPARSYGQIGRYGAVGEDVATIVWKPSAILPKALRMPTAK